MSEMDINEESKTVTVKIGSDTLYTIYTSGFLSGLQTALANFAELEDDQADEVAQRVMDALHEDETMRRNVMTQVAEIVTGIDSGPKSTEITVKRRG